MVFAKGLFAAALSASVVAAQWCATDEPSEEALATIRQLRESERASASSLVRRDDDEPITVSVYMHAVVNSTNSNQTLDQDSLQAQFDVLSEKFAPHNISFILEATDRLVDDDLSQGYTDPNWPGHMVSTRKGNYSTLNLWYVTNMDPSVGGGCTLPSANVTAGSITALLDGCTMQSYTVPGGQFNGTTYLGEVTVHEVGHWFNLLHTFNGFNCTGEGDYVDDTPAEASYIFMACPYGKDTCPEQWGLDPIHNFMDYSGDGCWTHFTPGQQTRMYSSWYTMRAPSA